MHLTIFDLDNTLLDGDSDYLWGRYLVEQGRVDAEEYERRNRAFYEDYQAGTLDIEAFAEFSMAPLATNAMEDLMAWRADFVARKIAPIVAPLAPALIERHRMQGDEMMIMTATNRFITEPIAKLLGIDTLIATEPEMDGGRYTGRLTGIPNFQDGKVQRLEQWLDQEDWQPAHITVYSDSHNDLPLMRRADTAVAVDADERLQEEARARGWALISLRGQPLQIVDESQ